MKGDEMKNKKLTIIILISLMFTYGTMTSYASEVFQDDEVYRTVEEINELRSKYDLPSFEYSESLNKAAYTHNKYMDFNKIYSSIEESGKLYYRGRYPWDRASYAGYENTYVFESLIQNVNTYSEGISYLMNNPYARYALLDPLYTDLGMNSYDEYTTFLLGGSERTSNEEIIYPYSGQQNIDVSFMNKYILDPYDGVVNVPEEVGVPITYSIYSSEAKVLEYNDLEVKLTNTRTNEIVDVEVITSLKDRNLTNTVMILPMEKYDYGTTYVVSISAKIRFNNVIELDNKSYWKNLNREWNFTTKQSSVSPATYSYVTRTEFVEELMKASNYSVRNSLEIIFPDVNISSPSYKYIYTAYAHNIIRGYDDGLYRPNANINREQAYTILIRNYENDNNGKGEIILTDEDRNLDFSDSWAISYYFLESLYKAKKIGLLVDNPYSFNPQVYITTSEFEDMMDKYNTLTN